MNAIDLFKREILRPLLTLCLPGLIGLLPYVYILIHHVLNAQRFWVEHEASCILIIIIAALFLGLILEDIGALIESRFRKVCDPDKIIWNKYISYKPQKDRVQPIGASYISDIVLRLKFELGTACALAILTIPGFVYIARQKGNLIYVVQLGDWAPYLIVISILVMSYLIVEANNSVILLHETRLAITAQFERDNVSDSKKSTSEPQQSIYKLMSEEGAYGQVLIAVFFACGISIIISLASFFLLPQIELSRVLAIGHPENSVSYQVGEQVPFEVRATPAIFSVDITVDKYPIFPRQDLIDGKLSKTYKFTSPGVRKITVIGYDSRNNFVLARQTEIDVKSSQD